MVLKLKKGKRLGLYYLAFLLLFSVSILFLQELSSNNQENFKFNNIYKEDNIRISTESDTHTIQWNLAWDGPSDEMGYAVAVDSSHNVYIAGRTNSYGAGGYDIVLVKYNTNGTQLWNLTWGGGGDEVCNAMAVDSSDDIYLVGNTLSFGFTLMNFV